MYVLREDERKPPGTVLSYVLQTPCARCSKKGLQCISQVSDELIGAVPLQGASGAAEPVPSEVERVLSGKLPPAADEIVGRAVVGPGRTSDPSNALHAALFPEITAAITAISAPDSSASNLLRGLPTGMSSSGFLPAPTSLEPDTTPNGSSQTSMSSHDAYSAAGSANRLQSHTAGQMSGQFGVIPRQPSRFNAGAFVLDCETCLDPMAMVQRLKTLVTTADDAHLSRVLYAARRSGGLPLRLLQPVAPWLTDLLRQRLAQSSSDALQAFTTPYSEPSPDVVFDGCHLGIVGFAAALVAWADDDTLAVTPPPHCVVSAPALVPTAHSRSTSSRKAAVVTATRSAAGETDDSDSSDESRPLSAAEAAGNSCCTLATLFDRWPNLSQLFHTAPDDVVEDCRILMQELHAGRSVFPGTSICELFADHLMACDTPCMTSVHGEAGGPPLYKAMNDSVVELLGFDSNSGCKASPPGVSGAKSPSGQPLRWLHPESILKRTLAFISAQNAGLRSFQMEVRYLRALGNQRSDTEHAHVATSAEDYVSIFALETCHMERNVDGRLLGFTSYLSDVVHCPTPEHFTDSELHAAELDAVDVLVLQRDKLPLEMAVAMRRLDADPVIVLAQCISDRATAGLFLAMTNLAFQPDDDFEPGTKEAPKGHMHDMARGSQASGSDSAGADQGGQGGSMLCDRSPASEPADPVSAASSVASFLGATPVAICQPSTTPGPTAAMSLSQDSVGNDDLEAARGMLQLQQKYSNTKNALLKRIPPQQLENLFDFVSNLFKRCREVPLTLVTRVGKQRFTEPHPLQAQGMCLDILGNIRHPRSPHLSLIDLVGGSKDASGKVLLVYGANTTLSYPG